MTDFNQASARVNKAVGETTERIEKETAEFIKYLNDEVVPAVGEVLRDEIVDALNQILSVRFIWEGLSLNLRGVERKFQTLKGSLRLYSDFSSSRPMNGGGMKSEI